MRNDVTRALTLGLAVMLVLAIGGVVYVALNPPSNEDTFTEFYLLGSEGNATGYPTDLSAAEQGLVVVGITNHEQRTIDYRLVVLWNETEEATRQITVADEETVETDTTVTAPDESGRYKLRFLLYRGPTTAAEPYRELHLWVTVRG